MATIVITSAEGLVEEINRNKEVSHGVKIIIKYLVTQPYLQLLADSNLGIHTEELSFIPIPRLTFSSNGIASSSDPRNKDCAIPSNFEERMKSLDFSMVSFPHLKALDIYLQAVKDIHFTKENMPILNSLKIESPMLHNVGKFNLDLPDLESIDFQHVNLDDGSGFGKSLSRCPKLKYFFSYKLWGLRVPIKDTHILALPNCEYLTLHRSDCLNYLNIWAPKLEYLNLQASYDLERVIILDQKPGGYCGPEYSFTGTPAKFLVNLINADVPKGNLDTHQRCRKILEEYDDSEFTSFLLIPPKMTNMGKMLQWKK